MASLSYAISIRRRRIRSCRRAGIRRGRLDVQRVGFGGGLEARQALGEGLAEHLVHHRAHEAEERVVAELRVEAPGHAGAFRAGLEAEVAVGLVHAVELEFGFDVGVLLDFHDGHLALADILVVAIPGVPGVESGRRLAVDDLRLRIEFVPGRPVGPVFQFVDLFEDRRGRRAHGDGAFDLAASRHQEADHDCRQYQQQ